MHLALYQKYDLEESLENFLNLHYGGQMKYFASDLLDNGLSPQAITNAVRRAMLAARSAGLNVREHFFLVYTERNGEVMRDCKLSQMGYALVMLNADVRNDNVAKWQVKILEYFLSNIQMNI
jgi:hypothetical protein